MGNCCSPGGSENDPSDFTYPPQVANTIQPSPLVSQPNEPPVSNHNVIQTLDHISDREGNH